MYDDYVYRRANCTDNAEALQTLVVIARAVETLGRWSAYLAGVLVQLCNLIGAALPTHWCSCACSMVHLSAGSLAQHCWRIGAPSCSLVNMTARWCTCLLIGALIAYGCIDFIIF